MISPAQFLGFSLTLPESTSGTSLALRLECGCVSWLFYCGDRPGWFFPASSLGLWTLLSTARGHAPT